MVNGRHVDNRFGHIFYCGLKAYIVFTFLDSFRNKSGKPQPIRTKVGTYAPKKFMKFRARSAKWGRNGGLKVSPTPSFLSAIPDDFSATSQRSIFAKFGHDTWIAVKTQILDRNLWKVSIQGSFAPKTPNLEGVKQVPHSEQATGHGMHCREILFTPHCSPRAREFPRSVIFFVGLRRTIAELRGITVAQFSEFGIFSSYKTPIKYLPVTSLQPRGYIAEWFRFFLCDSRRSKGVSAGREVFIRLLVGELGTPKLAQIFAYGKWL